MGYLPYYTAQSMHSFLNLDEYYVSLLQSEGMLYSRVSVREINAKTQYWQSLRGGVITVHKRERCQIGKSKNKEKVCARACRKQPAVDDVSCVVSLQQMTILITYFGFTVLSPRRQPAWKSVGLFGGSSVSAVHVLFLCPFVGLFRFISFSVGCVSALNLSEIPILC